VSYCSILFCTNSILSHGVNVKANRSESLLSKARGQRQTPPSPPDQSGSGRASNAAKANDADGGLTALYLRDDINCRHSLQRSDVSLPAEVVSQTQAGDQMSDVSLPAEVVSQTQAGDQKSDVRCLRSDRYLRTTDSGILT
jgi:hypothetical protein